ncbi:toast rack family protein [Lysinibacillus sp. NPDC097162]|uniref:toast rack family protein n=1 Tax=Lysinibacillus sp. NPDC097162 TaxID=3364140 RepID=UPI00380E7F5C
MKKFLYFALMVSASLIVLTGCSSFVPEKEKEDTFSVKKDDAKKLDVEINLGVGEMTVAKGATEWMEGSAQYNIKKLAPKVHYKQRGKTGDLVIEHKGSTKVRIGNIKNVWDIELNEDIPMDLSVETGASKARLDLRGLQLENLDIETGVGDLYVDLGGEWKESFETNIETGVGQTTVILPSKVGVKITTEKGIGSINLEGFIAKGKGVYVNEVYEQADVILDINSEIGVGDITFKLDK